MKKNLKMVVLALSLAASVAACKKKDGGGGGGGGETGVPECDDYLAKMDACAKKLGDKGGEGLTKMANMMRGSWKDDVKNEQMKKEMPSTCTKAIQDMKKQMPDCDWGGGAAAPAGPGSAAAAPAPAGSGSDTAAAPAPSGGGDLPAECNDYKTAVEALGKCDKLPAASKDALKQAYDQMSSSWANLPAEAKKNLGAGCKAAADALKQSTASFCN